MFKFLDGPAKDVVLCCARAPLFLRVVHDPTYATAICKKGRQEWDALDQLDDRPQPHETIYVYIKAEDHGTVHYDGRDRNGKRFGRWEQCASYRLFDQQPDDATARSREKWQAWAQARAAELETKKAL